MPYGPTLVILAFRLPILVGGSVMIEAVFSWPGIGAIISFQGVSASDYPVIMMTTLMIAAAMLLAVF